VQNETMQMDALITVRTELFNYREVKPHFINPCCFGEDFASWLKERISPLEDSGFKISEIIQEDYGWAFGPEKERILSDRQTSL